MTRNPNDALVRDHLARHPELALQMAPTARAPKLSPFALAAAPGDREVIAARELRVEQARAAHAAGMSLEDWLEQQHEAALLAGLAEVDKQNPAVTVGEPLGDGWFRAKWRTRSGADYRGTLRGGASLAVEAKSAGRGRLPLVDDGSPRFDGVKAHQRRALERALQMGGVALLVVRFTRQRKGHLVDTIYAAPWETVSALETVGPEDVAAWRVEPGRVYLARWAGGSAW